MNVAEFFSEIIASSEYPKLTNREYTKLVDEGKFPESPTVPFDEPFINGNGTIQNLLLEKFTSVGLIESRGGCIRANHYHKTDWHYAYVLSGTVVYYWRKVGDKDIPKAEQYVPGQMFFTPPMVEHTMFFPVPSTIITFAKNVRDHETHEADLIRVPLMKLDWVPESGRHICNFNPEVVDPTILRQRMAEATGEAMLTDKELAQLVKKPEEESK